MTKVVNFGRSNRLRVDFPFDIVICADEIAPDTIQTMYESSRGFAGTIVRPVLVLFTEETK